MAESLLPETESKAQVTPSLPETESEAQVTPSACACQSGQAAAAPHHDDDPEDDALESSGLAASGERPGMAGDATRLRPGKRRCATAAPSRSGPGASGPAKAPRPSRPWGHGHGLRRGTLLRLRHRGPPRHLQAAFLRPAAFRRAGRVGWSVETRIGQPTEPPSFPNLDQKNVP